MSQAPNPNATILSVLDAIAAEVSEAGLTLGELFDRLDERAFGALLFALALPCCLPFLYVVPQIVALPMAFLALQMVIGRHEPWLPTRFAHRRIDREGLEKTAKGGRRFFGWAERLAKPRLTFLTGPKAQPLIGVFLCLFCASILVPLPATNTVPGFGVALVAFGLMARDGLLTLGGLVIGSAWLTLLATGGLTLLRALLSAL